VGKATKFSGNKGKYVLILFAIYFQTLIRKKGLKINSNFKKNAFLIDFFVENKQIFTKACIFA
jgi:hypothetical protein